MAIYVCVNGIHYPSRMAYYRTLEEQGARSDASFYVHMHLKHDPVYRKNESDRTSKARMLRYKNDLEYRKSCNAKRLRYYHMKKQNQEK